VRLRPRNWIDTLEDLVPIGGAKTRGRSERASGGADERSPRAPERPTNAAASAWLGEDEAPVPFDAAASAGSDFWGERAASVQDAVRAPVERRPTRPRAAAARRSLAQLDLRLPAPRVAAATLGVILAVLVAFAASAALTGATGARPARSHTRDSAPTVSASQIAQVAKALTPEAIPPLAGSRTHKPKLAKHHAPPVHAAAAVHHAAQTSAAPASSTPAPATATTSAPLPARSAGPSGPISLLGPGTSPSG
jgi:hypothetical protein